jgi:hypothetical protein
MRAEMVAQLNDTLWGFRTAGFEEVGFEECGPWNGMRTYEVSARAPASVVGRERGWANADAVRRKKGAGRLSVRINPMTMSAFYRAPSGHMASYLMGADAFAALPAGDRALSFLKAAGIMEGI